VYKYIATEAFPERAPRAPSGVARSILDPYTSYLRQRTEQGGANGQQLYREVREQGYSGSCKTVVRWLQAQGLLPRHSAEQELDEKGGQNLQVNGQAAGSEPRFPSSSSESLKQITLPGPLPSAQALSWLLVKDPTSLKAKEQQVLAFVKQESAIETMYLLTRQFSRLLKERQAEQLEAWLKIGAECGIPEIEAFSQGVRRDFDAVKAAFQFPYSNGPAGGVDQSAQAPQALDVWTRQRASYYANGCSARSRDIAEHHFRYCWRTFLKEYSEKELSSKKAMIDDHASKAGEKRCHSNQNPLSLFHKKQHVLRKQHFPKGISLSRCEMN
jgi:hypothetical protein